MYTLAAALTPARCYPALPFNLFTVLFIAPGVVHRLQELFDTELHWEQRAAVDAKIVKIQAITRGRQARKAVALVTGASTKEAAATSTTAQDEQAVGNELVTKAQVEAVKMEVRAEAKAEVEAVKAEVEANAKAEVEAAKAEAAQWKLEAEKG